MMRELSWFERGRGSTEGGIRRLEAEIGLQLPADVVDFLRSHAGDGNPVESEFDCMDAAGRRVVANFGSVLDVDAGSEDGIATAMREIEGLPAGLVPIVATGSGDYACVDLRAGSGAIVLYCHEVPSSDCIVLVATDLATFLDLLRVPEDL